MFSFLILLSVFYVIEGKALQIEEDGTINGEHFNYIYENSYVNKNSEDLHRPYIDSKEAFKRRYVPHVDGHPIFIPPLDSSMYEHTEVSNKVLPEPNWSQTYQSVLLEGQDGRHSKWVSDASAENRDVSHEILISNSPLKINTQIEKYPIGKTKLIQQYSYGKKPIKTMHKVSGETINQMSQIYSPGKISGYSADNYIKLRPGREKVKYDKAQQKPRPINVDKVKDSVLGLQPAERDVNYDYPKLVQEWSTSPGNEHYYNPVIVEKLVKETPSEGFDNPLIVERLIKQNQGYLDHDFEYPKVLEKVSENDEFSKKESEKKKNVMKDYNSKYGPASKNREMYKTIVNEDYEEPHVVGASQKQNLIQHKVQTDHKFTETLPIDEEMIVEEFDDYSDTPSVVKVKTVANKKPVQILSQKKPVKYPTEHKNPDTQTASKYYNLPSKQQSKFTVKHVAKKPVKKLPNHKVKKNEIKKTEIKGSEHADKIKIDEIQTDIHSEYIPVKVDIPSKSNDKDYQMLDKKDALFNVPEMHLDDWENPNNIPFEVGSGIIQERDASQESRNLFSESGIWSQMVNFHTQERGKFKKCLTPKNETGNCMPIQLCPDPNLALTLDDLVKKVCPIDDVFVGICCPEFSAETLKVDWENLNTNPSEDENSETSAVSCGHIVNSGKDVLSWPWMAPLISASTRRIFCGGVLINEQYVLTAAHCTRRIPRNQILVILGPLNSTQNPPNQEFTVGEIKRHSRYNPRTMQNDIALLKLMRPVPMGEFRRFVCLPSETDSFVGEKAIMLGWQGSFEMTKDVETLRILSDKECKHNLGTLCTEPRTDDSMCNLDSGAPLIIDKDGSYTVIGILIWNRNDCDSRFPEIYTNVSSFRHWIDIHSSN